ncbi:MAG: hypothetical protein LBD38_03765, partial [Streptococcaceae bacterium]|nr:hypothetical protein [Streptococcaceae bacterium]
MIFAIQNSLKKYKAIIREILSKLNDVDLKMCNLLELARKDDEYARAMTQCQPLEIPLPPKAFFVKVKIDYPGVIIPND